MIKIKNLNKSYDNIEILKNVNLSIDEGEVLSIIGPSGSGKSTLLRCLNYLEIPNDGELQIDGKTIDLSRMGHKDIDLLRSLSSMVFQHYNLFKNKTALENVALYLRLVKKIPRLEAESEALEYLSQVNLSEKKDSYPSELSGGQQQRVGIARAMAVKPKMILLDEPTSSLDPELVQEVLLVIEKLAKENQTMIIVTHEMEFAKRISDKVIFIDKGEIAESGSSDDVFNHPKSMRLKKFLDQW